MNRKFDDYVKVCARIGASEFRRRYSKGALVGLAVVGELEENGERGRASTFLAAIHGEESESASFYRRVWLIVKDQYGPASESVWLGRTSENDIVVPDYSISMNHCEFVKAGNKQIAMRDHNSHNGTFVNGVKVLPGKDLPLENEDEVVIGRFKFEYLEPATFVKRVVQSTAFASVEAATNA